MPKKKKITVDEPPKTMSADDTLLNVLKDWVSNKLINTGRQDMAGLVDYMDTIGFFTAPASGGNHSNGEGGLLIHSVNVCVTAQKLTLALYPDVDARFMESVIVASLLHDLGKCGDYGKQMYVPNMILDGRPTKADPEQHYKQSEKKPWKRNPDLLPLDHATRSIKLATLFIDLTEDEEYAIRYHDGLYETANYAVKGNETPLYMILHWADLWSARVLEGSDGEEDG